MFNKQIWEQYWSSHLIPWKKANNYIPHNVKLVFSIWFSFFFMSTESAAVQIVLQNKCSVFSRLYLLLSSDWSRCIICLQKEDNNNKMLNSRFLCVFFKEQSCFSLRLAFLCNKYTQSPPCYEVASRNMTVLSLLYKSSLNPGHQDRQSRSNHSARSSPWSPVTAYPGCSCQLCCCDWQMNSVALWMVP